jgi:ribosomal 50S subunit-associated protein YjgA (DUF615 family)
VLRTINVESIKSSVDTVFAFNRADRALIHAILNDRNKLTAW